VQQLVLIIGWGSVWIAAFLFFFDFGSDEVRPSSAGESSPIDSTVTVDCCLSSVCSASPIHTAYDSIHSRNLSHRLRSIVGLDTCYIFGGSYIISLGVWGVFE